MAGKTGGELAAGDYLNSAPIGTFLNNRGANNSPKGAYLAFYCQEHAGISSGGILNFNGFGTDSN